MLDTIYLVRHGETVWNAAGRFQGARDSALTARGREQAAAVGRVLAATLGNGSAPLVAHVSPRGRTQETAAILGRHVALELREEPRLAEVSLGCWEGLTEYEIEVEYPGVRAGTTAFDWYFRSPDGERLEAARERVAAWLAEVRGPVLAVSHGLVGRIVRGVFLGLTDEAMLELPIPQHTVYALVDGPVRSIRELP
ncbi:MAG: histidine phosphatase family protein [Polyangiaceae bacterium]|nr:histidine phosphatase family protein [Polyangiaceae bacterium]